MINTVKTKVALKDYLQIVDADENQFNIIRNIAHKTWPDTFEGIIPREQINYMLNLLYTEIAFENQIRDHGNVFILSKIGDKSNGFAAYQHGYENSNQTKLHQLYVLPDYQQKGIGKKLLDEVIRRSKKNKSERIILNVNRKNPAVDFYVHVGFKIEKHEDTPIGNGFFMNDYVMTLDIT